jgi:hypothetical protein
VGGDIQNCATISPPIDPAAPPDANPTNNTSCTTASAVVPPSVTTYVYSVKYVCGMVQPLGPKPTPLPSLQSAFPVVPGVYRTAVNVHNFTDLPVRITKKAVVALPEDQPRGAISDRVKDILNGDEALEVGCQDVLKLLGGAVNVDPQFGFITGFVEIRSPNELQVTAVYTMEELLEKGVSIDVEAIQPHVIKN